MTIKSLSYNALYEIHYHTWVLKTGSYTFVFTGTKEGLKKAIERIWKEHPPYKPSARKVE